MRIFYNVDTQKDFMNKNGALYVPGAEAIKPSLKKLHQYAQENNVPIWGSRDRHFSHDSELIQNSGPFPDHCMDGTTGMENISETAYSGIIVPNKIGEINGPRTGQFYNPSKREMVEIIGAARKGENIMFEKQHYDVFTNVAVEPIFNGAGVSEAVLFGVATEYCNLAAAKGMRNLGIDVYVVKEAIEGITDEGAQAAIDEMGQRGVQFVNLEDVLEGRI